MTRNISKIIILIASATVLLTACTDEQTAEQQRLPITLTASITPTRAIASPTQETQLVEGQDVYVWANEETSGSVDWTQKAYIRAWNLTTGSSGALSSSNSYYYPSGSLSMVAIHGNFSFTEGTDAFPGIVTHTVSTDQSTLANYAASDLLYWTQSGVTGSSSALPVTFGHKLSKIEIHLSSSEYTTAQLNDMEVTLNNVLPTANIDLTDGSISEAYGSETSIRPYKTNYVDYEAIIPPQTRPHDFIKVTYKGTVVNVEAQVTGFDANNRYVYDFDMINKDIRKNPLWYVADYNINYDGSSVYSWATTPCEGYYFTWNDAMNLAFDFGEWHLPSAREFASISPGFDSEGNSQNIFNLDNGSGTYKESLTDAAFGYNIITRNGISEDSYWVKVSDTEVHALRFLGTDYCSAWKYVLDVSNDVFIISSTLIGNVGNSEAAARTWYSANWNNVYWGNNESLGAVQKYFHARKYNTSGSSTTYSEPAQMYGTYWSSSYTSYPYRLWFGMSGGYGSHINSFNSTWGCSVRLFRNETKAKTTTDLATISVLSVGDVVCSNGYIFSSSNVEDLYNDGFTPIGIIAYVATGENDAIAENKRALVISLRETNGLWASEAQWKDESSCANVANMAAALTDYGGLAKTNALKDAYHTAFQNAYNYGSTVPVPPIGNCSNWFVLSAGQWLAVLRSMGGQTLAEQQAASYENYYDTDNSGPKNIINAFNCLHSEDYDRFRFGLYTQQNYYWSASERDNSRAILFYFNTGDSNEGTKVRPNTKRDNLPVRPFFAF